MLLSRTNNTYPRCHLALRHCRTLYEIPAYLGQLTYVLTSQNTGLALFPAPSAVHLTNSFSPISQQRGLSVQASSPLSPHQRFLFTCLKYNPGAKICQAFFTRWAQNRMRHVCTRGRPDHREGYRLRGSSRRSCRHSPFCPRYRAWA